MTKTGLVGLGVMLGALLIPSVTFAQYYYPSHNYDRDDDVACFPAEQTVEEGQRAYFIAYGGDGDYDWEADGRTYRDRTNTFSFEFDDEGTERVEVTSDGESDICRVKVVERLHHYPNYPIYPAAPIYTQPVTINSTYMPQAMPNTGFPPVSSAALAFAAVLLFGVGLASTPYVRKALTSGR